MTPRALIANLTKQQALAIQRELGLVRGFWYIRLLFCDIRQTWGVGCFRPSVHDPRRLYRTL